MKTNLPGDAIPGETPIDDISGLLLKGKIRTRQDLNLAEAENITLAVAKYLVGRVSNQDAPFTYDWFFELHREMFGKVWNWAGVPRKTNLNLGSPFHRVEEEVWELVQCVELWGRKKEQILEEAALLHHRAVKIHPFLNGNGRWARLLTNIWLRKHRQKIILWPDNYIGEVSPARKEYLAALQEADNGDMEPLHQLHGKYQAD